MALQNGDLEVDTVRSSISPRDGLLSSASDYTDGRLHSIVTDDKKQTSWMTPDGVNREPQEKKIFGFRKATFWLSIATAIALASAIVAAAVGGYLAAKRSHELHQLQQQQINLPHCGLESNSTSLPASSAPQTLSTPQASSTPPTSATNSQADATGTITTSSPQASGSLSPQSNDSCACTPASDCASMGSTWTSELVNFIQFDIYCNTHYSGGDIAGFTAYQFEDCINACATYNTLLTAHPDSNCTAVTYGAGATLPNTCYLKDSTAQQSIELGVDSAVLVHS